MQQKRISFLVGSIVVVALLFLTAGLVWYDSAAAQTDEEPAKGNDDVYTPSTADHTQFEVLQQPFKTGPEVTAACLECHTEAAKQVMETPHWNWSLQTENGEVVGKQNVINNYCVALSSNEPRCTSCHAGYGWNGNEPFDFTKETNVDCLVCHDTTGQYKKFPAGSGHPVYEEKEFPPGSGKIWYPPNLTEIAQNVGATSRATCGACHFYGGGGDGVKHGDLDSSMTNPSRDLDVHMDAEGLDFACTECHVTEGHKVPGSRYEMTAVDTHGLDLPVREGDVATCESCHGLTPMQDAKLNDHVDKIACQTCHIPEFARVRPTKMWWDWSQAGKKNEDGTPIVTKDDNGWVTYDTKKGEFVWEMNVVPEYVWFNGTSDYMTIGEKIDDTQEVVTLNPIGGSPNDPNARIWPMKLFQGMQPYDPVNKVLVVPNLFPSNPDDKEAYWKSYDWNLAIETGMASVGQPYSGEYDFVRTQMYWPITHMVAPKEDALACEDCHSENGRLAGLEGVYMPAVTQNNTVDTIGWGASLLALVGVVTHGTARFASRKKNGGK